MNEKLHKLKDNIKKHGHKLKNPTNNKFDIKDTHSWYSQTESKEGKLFKDAKIKHEKLISDGCRTERIELYLTSTQKEIMNKWLNACIIMYNETIKYFRTCRFKNKKIMMNIGKLKKLLNTKKTDIVKWSTIKINNKNVHINKHILDYAINDALMRYKSCLTNIKNNNIKHFRLRYLKMNKPNKILKIEKEGMYKKGFCKSVFGKVKCAKKNFNYKKEIKEMSTIQFTKNKYYILIKYKFKKNKHDTTEIASIDPGLRTPFMIYSNNKIVRIGENMSKMLRQKNNSIDKINNNVDLSKSQKKYKTKKIYIRMKNKIKDFHWKVINYLTSTYATILIGNLSTKNIVETDTLNSMTKRIAGMFSLYQFKKRLKYKCVVNNVKFKEVDEAYTSKCCSNCGNCKEDLGASKRYKCNNCKIEIDRDVNGAKNILLVEMQ